MGFKFTDIKAVMWLAIATYVLLCFANAATVHSAAVHPSAPVVYNVSTMLQLQAAVLHATGPAASIINVQTSIIVTGALQVTGPSVTIRGVLQRDGSRPRLDCAEELIRALFITGKGTVLADLEITRCYETAVVVVPDVLGYTYLFSNVLFSDNSCLESGAGALWMGRPLVPVEATLLNCAFVNNSVSPLADTEVYHAAAMSVCYGSYTLTNCTFVGNGRDASGSATSVGAIIQFWPHYYTDGYDDDYDNDLEHAVFTLSAVLDGLVFVNNSGLNARSEHALIEVQSGQHAPDTCNITIRNSLLANNSGQAVFEQFQINDVLDSVQSSLGCSVLFKDTRVVGNSIGAENTGPMLNFYGTPSVVFDGVEVSHNTGIGSVMATSHVKLISMRSSNFTHNDILLAGVQLNPGADAVVTIDNCVFDGNRVLRPAASIGGAALFVASAMNSLLVTGSSFLNNGGASSGGAVYVTVKINHLNFSNSAFINNTALVGGGAVYYEAHDQNFQSPALFDQCIFVSNTAAYGGAVMLKTANSMNFVDCFFKENQAASGGAVVVLNNYNQITFQGCTFTLNRAVVPDTEYKKDLLLANACGPGGGGAFCAVGAGLDAGGTPTMRITLQACWFSNNTATYGGAVFVGEGSGCSLLRELYGNVSCYPLDLFACEFLGNSAPEGAGGAVYSEYPDVLNVVCSAEQGGWVEELAPAGMVLNSSLWVDIIVGDYADYQTSSAYKTVFPSKVSFKMLPCRSWTNNSAPNGGYGPIVATPPLNVTMLPPLAPAAILSLDLIPVLLRATDWYEQLATSSLNPVLAVASLATGASAQLFNAVVSADQGVVNMTHLQLQATPGMHIVSIVVHQTAAPNAVLATFDFVVLVNACPVNYVTNEQNNECLKCRPGLYSINPKSRTCLTCPNNAICSDLVVGGGVIVPVPGYWHSHPFSAEMHPCDNAAACTALGRTRSLAAAQELYLSANSAGANTSVLDDMLQSYLTALCTDEYQGGGVLCGQCSSGFGHVAVVTCKACLPRNTVIFLHILLTLVTLLFIILTIRSSLSTARWRRVDTAVLPQHHADVDHCPLATPTLQMSNRHRISSSLRSEQAHLRGPDTWLPCGDPYDDCVLPLPGSSQAGTAAGLPPPVAEEGHDLCTRKKVQGGTVSVRMAKGSLSSDAAQGSGSYGGGGLSPEAITPHVAGSRGAAADVEEEEPQHMTIILILVSYLQVLAMPRRISLLWPDLLTRLLDVVSVSTSAASSLASFECFLIQGQRVMQVLQISIIQVLEPMVMVVLIYAFWAVRVAYKRRIDDLKVPMAVYLKPRLILSACVVVFYVYPSITDVIISTFACQSADSAAGMDLLTDLGYATISGSVGTFWREELNQLCYTGQHLIQFWVIGVPGLVVFAVGVPAACMLFLWLHQHKLEEHGFKALWGFLYEDYQPHSFYWEAMGELRKLAIITIISLVSSARPDLQLQICLGVLAAALVAQVLVKPYSNAAMNRLESLALLALLVTFYLLTYFASNQLRTPAATTALSVLIAAVNASTILYMLYCLALEVVKQAMASKHLQKATKTSVVQMLTRSKTNLHATLKGLSRWGSRASTPPRQRMATAASQQWLRQASSTPADMPCTTSGSSNGANNGGGGQDGGGKGGGSGVHRDQDVPQPAVKSVHLGPHTSGSVGEEQQGGSQPLQPEGAMVELVVQRQ